MMCFENALQPALSRIGHQTRGGVHVAAVVAVAVADDASGGGSTEAFCLPRYLVRSCLFAIRCIRRSAVIVCK